jgi:hypothetical protein
MPWELYDNQKKIKGDESKGEERRGEECISKQTIYTVINNHQPPR